MFPLAMDKEDLTLFGEIVSMLATAAPKSNIRERVVGSLARLMHADFCTSYVWNPATGRSEQPYSSSMTADGLEDYDRRFQFHDPITARLRAFRRPVLVEEAMPYSDLERTEFYNEFLKREGMYRGMNLFLFDGGRDVGDLRIWRGRGGTAFGEREIGLLSILQPFLKQAFTIAARDTGLNLSTREREVAMLVAKGCRDRDIARILDIGFGTVRTHINNAMTKCGCANRAELAALLMATDMERPS
ncbi:MAG: LuxR family transcriptional regulator [Rhizobiaceae bacterium]|nr:LuxR family transcriptional regulator [Rhizobiaceae bacterium]